MKVLDAIVEALGFDKDSEIKDIARYVYNHRIYITDLDDSLVPEKVKQAARNFLVKDEEFYDGDEASAWGRFLDMDLEGLTKEPCEHKNVIIGNAEGSQIEEGLYEIDLVIYCSDCHDDLFRISEYERNIVNLSKY